MGGHMTLRQHAEGQRNGPRGFLAFEVRVWQPDLIPWRPSSTAKTQKSTVDNQESRQPSIARLELRKLKNLVDHFDGL